MRAIGELQDMTLVDGAGSKPAYNLRTLSRALQYARIALPQYGLQRALYDGCAMAFLTQLHPSSAPAMERLLQTHILAGASLKVNSCVLTGLTGVDSLRFGRLPATFISTGSCS